MIDPKKYSGFVQLSENVVVKYVAYDKEEQAQEIEDAMSDASFMQWPVNELPICGHIWNGSEFIEPAE